MRLKGRVDRLGKRQRNMGPCSRCRGKGRINVFLLDEEGRDIGSGLEPPGGCPACGKVLRMEIQRVRQIEKLWH